MLEKHAVHAQSGPAPQRGWVNSIPTAPRKQRSGLSQGDRLLVREHVSACLVSDEVQLWRSAKLTACAQMNCAIHSQHEAADDSADTLREAASDRIPPTPPLHPLRR